jgi:transposase
MSVYTGADVSKGYADSCVLAAEGEGHRQLRLDDTREGHDRMEELVRTCAGQQDETLLVGLEATGGLELNWLSALKALEQSDDLTVYQLNPYVLRKFVEQRLHVSKTDASSARSIADYLRRGLAEDHAPYREDGPSRDLRTLARKTKRMIGQSVQLKNELQALLQRAHPELVQHLRGRISQWMLKLIREYPTPTKLLETAPKEVAEIPYVTEAKATRLIENARTSVASQQDEDTGLALSMMAEDLLRIEKRIDRRKGRL